MTPRRALSVLSLALVLASARGARAEGATRRDVTLRMQGSGWYDAAYIGGAGAFWAIGVLVLKPPAGHVAPLDGRGHHPHDDFYARASDLTVGFAAPVAMLAAYGIEAGARTPGSERLRGSLVLGEAALVGGAVVGVVKNLAGVCRPRSWDGERCLPHTPKSFDPEELLSFPSGHSVPIAAMAGASYGLWLFPEGRNARYLPLALSLTAVAVTVPVLRIKAGAHTWVDTLTGGLIGAAVGLGTAALHLAKVETTAATGTAGAPSTAPPQVVSLGGAF